MVVLDPMVAKINTVVPNLVFNMNCLTKAKNAGKNVTKMENGKWLYWIQWL